VVSPVQERTIFFTGRLTGNPISTVGAGNDSNSGSNYLGANIHFGVNPDLLTSSEFPLETAKAYVSPTPDPETGFKATVSVAALADDIETRTGATDPGILAQVLPVSLGGSGRVLGIKLQYKMFLDGFGLYKARFKTRESLLLEGHSFDAKFYTVSHGKRRFKMPFFKHLRVRMIIDSITVDEVGALHIHVGGVEIRVKALFGLLNLKVGGPYLNQQLTNLFSGIPLLQISKTFDISLPRCIIIDENAPHDTENCTGPGLLKHVAGYRGARATLRVQKIDFSVDRQAASVTGSLEVKGIGVNDK
jgi:hypothetical protein